MGVKGNMIDVTKLSGFFFNSSLSTKLNSIAWGGHKSYFTFQRVIGIGRC